jgi:hypothetical protein
MTDAWGRALKSIGGLAIVTALLGLPGCGGLDGVDFNGKVFDAVGLTGALGKKAEPNTEARTPLVLPPRGQNLPEPGGSSLAAAPPAADASWPQDPDKQKVAKADAQKKAQADYCRDGNWKEKAMKDQAGAEVGPSGNCGSIFTIIGKSLMGE